MAHRQAGFFVDGSDPHGVLLAAVVALPKEASITSAGLAIRHLVDLDGPAMNAARAIAPALLFKELDGGQFILAGQWDCLDDRRVGQMMLLPLLHGLILYLTQF